MKRIVVLEAERVGRWVVERAGGAYHAGDQAIGVAQDDTLIAGVLYNGYTGRGGSISMHQRVDNKRAATREFLWTIFDYPFNQLKVKSIFGLVDVNNKAALLLDLHLGFLYEARLRDYFPTGDAVLLRMTREDCRFLNWRRDHVRIQDRAAA